MAALERVMQMQSSGMSESQIINALRQEGVSPKEIYDALTQSQIKTELSQNPEVEYGTETMQPSMNEEEQANIEQGEYTPEQSQPEDYPEYQSQAPIPQEYYQEYPSQAPAPQMEEYYPNQQYQEYQAPQQQATDIETINEIAEQIVEEKNALLKKQISEIVNFKEEMKIEIERLNKKIEKIETNMNELQISIIRSVGNYGEDIKNISQEMHETQNSFSKIINPLTDNIRELQKITGALEPAAQKKEQPIQTQEPPVQEQPQAKRIKKNEPGFEDYLR